MTTLDPYTDAISRVIKEQAQIIGPLALQQARKVEGLTVQPEGGVSIEGEPAQVLSDLVAQYAKLFGQASIEVCRDALSDILPTLPSTGIPALLR